MFDILVDQYFFIWFHIITLNKDTGFRSVCGKQKMCSINMAQLWTIKSTNVIDWIIGYLLQIVCLTRAYFFYIEAFNNNNNDNASFMVYISIMTTKSCRANKTVTKILWLNRIFDSPKMNIGNRHSFWI